MPDKKQAYSFYENEPCGNLSVENSAADRIPQSHRNPAIMVRSSCEDLMRLITRPDGCIVEDLRAAAEYLLDAIKVAQNHNIRKIS